jgi:thiol-disulfide isomerase/thioredoxin
MPPITTTEGVVDKFGNDGPVLIEVYADWCKYCQNMKPIIERLQSEHPEINVKLINADENNIKMSLPRLIIVRTDGTYTDNEGAMPEEGFKLWVLSNYK